MAGLIPAWSSGLITLLVGLASGIAAIIGLAFKAGQWRGKHSKNVEDRDESIEEHSEAINSIEEKVDKIGEKVDDLNSNVETVGTRLEYNTKRIQRQNHTLHDVAIGDDETCSDPDCEWCHGHRGDHESVGSSVPFEDPSSGD